MRGGVGERRGRRLARRRRSPEQARQEILDAAERVFVEYQPNEVGLKEVAREAGVSHALITHYFGTYANMVDAVLERRVRALRTTILERLEAGALDGERGSLSRPGELLALLFAALRDPVHLRLTQWLFASERPSSAHAFALREQGLVLVAHQVAKAIDPSPSRQFVERCVLALMTAVAAAYGYSMGKYALAGAAGKAVSNELDAQVQKTLAEMLQAYLRGA